VEAACLVVVFSTIVFLLAYIIKPVVYIRSMFARDGENQGFFGREIHRVLVPSCDAGFSLAGD
jgi:hypothetical protein